ncbi:MAG: porin, partial [Gammaproteobacteria bacterium]|nr:porin [Gammaproteobacteria bacterium]
RWNHSANGLAWWELAKNTRFEIKDAFSITEDPAREDDYTLRQGRFNQTNNLASARLSHRFGAKDRVYIDYAYRLLEDESPLAEDRNTHNPSLGLTYWFTPAWGVDVSGGYSKGNYSGITDDFDDYSGTLRLTHAFTKHFSSYVEYTHTERDYIGLTEDYKVYDPSAGINWAI